MARLDFLRAAAGTLAATWFMLRGCVVSFPAEPARCDLLRTYRKYIVGNARGLLADVDARSAEVRASA